MSRWRREDDAAAFEAEMARQERSELSPAGIAESNRHLVDRQRRFRRAADVAVGVLTGFGEVEAVSLFGSVARSLWKEVPRFRSYRRAGIALWHECADVDIAVWLSDLRRLREIRRSIDRALPVIHRDTGAGVASHELDIFVFEPGTDRYLGRMCQFKACQAHQRACLAPGCGDVSFLQQLEGFTLRPDALAPDRSLRLYDRTSGESRRAVELPDPEKG